MHHNSILIKIQLDATVCNLIYFTAKSFCSKIKKNINIIYPLAAETWESNVPTSSIQLQTV